MNNADKPAMPTELRGSDGFPPIIYTGLTKREMFAMNADVGECSIKTIADAEEFIGRKIDAESIEDTFKANFEVTAKLKVMAADALLAELEK